MTFDPPRKYELTKAHVLDRYAEAQLNLKRNRNDPRWHRQVRGFEAILGGAVEEVGGLDA